MMDSKKRTLFTLTFVLGLLGVGMLVASLATDYWLESRPVRNVDDDTLAVAINVTGGDLDTKFTGYIHFGLFHGSKSLDYGFGPRHSEISVWCLRDEDVCAYVTDKTTAREDLQQILQSAPVTNSSTNSITVVGVVSSSRRLSGCGGAAARRAKAELLRKLERGQQVKSMGKDGSVIMDTVVTVDRFDMTVLVDSCEVLFVDEITVSGAHTHSPGVESEEEPRPREKKTHKVAKRVSEAATEPKAKKVCAEPLPKLPAMGPESVSCVDGAAVGKVFQIKGTNANVLCTALGLKSKRAECILASQDGLDLDSMLSLPAKKLEPSKLRLGRADQRYADACLQSSVDATLRNFCDSSFRLSYRQNVLATQLNLEIGGALRPKGTSTSNVTLGPAWPDVDFQLLGLDPPRQETAIFSVRGKNLQELDALLGDRWDMLETEACIRFVTQLKLSVQPLPIFMLKASIAVGRYDGQLRGKASYRKQLLDHVVETERLLKEPSVVPEHGDEELPTEADSQMSTEPEF